jgi:hypothetical protein
MLFADNITRDGGSNVVDIFNSITGVWSTATLSVGRYAFAATSLPNQGLAIFAGGQSKSRDCFVAAIDGRLVARG